MRIISEDQFMKIKDVKLNRDGREIGEIQRFMHKIVYKKYVYPEHYFIKFRGFGIERTILKSICIPKKDHDLLQEVDWIVLFYKGKKYRRYYKAEPFRWLEEGILYGTAKEGKVNVEAYGEQLILPLKKMQILGYDKDDIKARKRDNNIKRWDKWKKDSSQIERTAI